MLPTGLLPVDDTESMEPQELSCTLGGSVLCTVRGERWHHLGRLKGACILIPQFLS